MVVDEPDAEHLQLPLEQLALPRPHVGIHEVHDLVDVLVVLQLRLAQGELGMVRLFGRGGFDRLHV